MNNTIIDSTKEEEEVVTCDALFYLGPEILTTDLNNITNIRNKTSHYSDKANAK